MMVPPSAAKAMDFHGLSYANSLVEAERVRYPLDTAAWALVNALFATWSAGLEVSAAVPDSVLPGARYRS
jgi:hypothetical protein